MGSFLDNFIILALAVSIVVLSLSMYGIATQDSNTCSSNYIASVVASAVSTGSTLILLFVVLIRLNNLCPFTKYLPVGATLFNQVPQQVPQQYSVFNPQQYLPYLNQISSQFTS